AGNRVLRLDELADGLQKVDVLVLPNARAAVADASPRLDRGGLHDHDAVATDGAGAQVDQMPVVGESILAQVLAHRGHTDSVLAHHVTDSNGRKQERSRLLLAATLLVSGWCHLVAYPLVECVSTWQ